MVEIVQSVLEVELCDILLGTPLIPAAGTLSKEALSETEGVYGAVLPKTVTPAPRRGNPPPRLAEAPSGMVNRIGLPNPGLERFLTDLSDYDVGLPIFASVAADTVKKFAAMCKSLAEDERVRAIELNLSCPNAEGYGRHFCAESGTVKEVVAACRNALPEKPLFAKLSDEGAVADNALAAEAAGADALTLINTIRALVIDAQERRIRLRGGLSGPAIKPIALRVVHEVSQEVKLPIIGAGGVASGMDVAEFMLAGASAVQVGSASFVREPREILVEFTDYLRENGLRARDLKGELRGA